MVSGARFAAGWASAAARPGAEGSPRRPSITSAQAAVSKTCRIGLGFSRSGRMPMSRARDLLQVHPASVTNTVDRLEAADLVRRTPNPRDGRSFLVEITPAGAEVLDRATKALNEQVFAAIDFDGTDLQTLTRLLAGFRRRHGDFRDPVPHPEPF